jgi:membrane protein
VDSADDQQLDEPAPPRSRLERTRLQAAELQQRGQRLADRAQEERRRHSSLDAVFDMADRDSEVGGGIIAGALAYRLFIWLLPLALVLIAGLGFAADASSESPEEAANSVGLAAFVSSSVASASNSSARWYALLVGIPVLVWTTRSLLRILIGAHRLIWTDVRAAAPKPTLVGTFQLLALVLAFYVVSGMAAFVRAKAAGVLGLPVTLLATLPYAGLWLLISIRMPHRGARWLDLVPGALLFGLGVEVLHFVAVYVLGPLAISKRGTYGALGIAAALLFGLYLTSRLVVAAAVMNATLWERRARAG